MIIGKAGAYIKQLKEISGCFVQISQKAKDTTLQERCITVSGIICWAFILPTRYVLFVTRSQRGRVPLRYFV